MMPMGDGIGGQLTRSRKVGRIAAFCFPHRGGGHGGGADLQVLARQVPTLPDPVIILTVAVGVGVPRPGHPAGTVPHPAVTYADWLLPSRNFSSPPSFPKGSWRWLSTRAG